MKRMTRLLAAIILIIAYFSTASVLWILYRHPWKLRQKLHPVVQLTSRLMCAIFGVKVQLKGIENFDPQKNYFIVSNHLSYLDILIMAALFKTSFVTSMEMKKTPILGQICYLAGSLFVERRSRDNLSNEIKEITLALEHKLNVLVFPEATSSNGEGLLRFRRPLYQASIDAKIPVLPLCLHFKTVDGKPLTISNRDQVCWYGDMTFAPHFLNYLKTSEVCAELEVLKPIDYKIGRDTTELAQITYDLINSQYAAHKVVNHSAQNSKDKVA